MSFFSALKNRFAELDSSLFGQKPLDGEPQPTFINRLNNIFVGGFNGNSANANSSGLALNQVSQNINLSNTDIKAQLQREALRGQGFANVVPSPSQSASVNPANRVFKTNGGVWYKAENGTVKFQHGETSANRTDLFDEEYYRPDPNLYPNAAAGKWIRLNPNGDARDLPENKGKPQPENISNFDWKGFEWVDIAQVPASYTAEGKTVAFSDPKNAENQLNVLKRYVVDNNLVGAWDEAKFQNIFSGSISSEIRLELTEAGKTAEGKTIFNVQMSGESLAKLRQGLSQYNREIAAETEAGAEGQREATKMVMDVPKVYENAARNTVNGTVGLAIELRATTDPTVQAFKPHIKKKLEIERLEYESNVMNRDITGKVNPEGITTGKVAEVAVEIAAPTIAEKVVQPARAFQTLETLNALPSTKALANSNVLRSTVKGTEIFDPAKLQKIQANLEKRGVAFVTGEEGERMAKFYGAEALYIPDAGIPGIIVLGKNPSTTAVVEELIHLGQHRRLGWADITGKVPKLEIEAQEKLLKLGKRLGWSEDEMSRIRRALETWRKQQ